LSGFAFMAWHIPISWHNVYGLILSLTLPEHYLITLSIHVLKLALGKGIVAGSMVVPSRRVLHGLYALSALVPSLLRTGESEPAGR